MKVLLLAWISCFLLVQVLSQNYYYGDDENVIENSNQVEVVEKQDRFFLVPSVFNKIADPSNEAVFIIRLTGQIVSIWGGYILTHFMSWDYGDTQPGEEINLPRTFNFFANPETAMLGTTALFGHAFVSSVLLWILPAIFWGRTPFPETPVKVSFARSNDRCSTKRTTSTVFNEMPMAFRSLMSPDGVVKILLVMAVEHAGFILFWLLSPYFTGSAFSSTTSSTGRCIRDVESPDEWMRDSEEFILKSIEEEPSYFYNSTTFYELP